MVHLKNTTWCNIKWRYMEIIECFIRNPSDSVHVKIFLPKLYFGCKRNLHLYFETMRIRITFAIIFLSTILKAEGMGRFASKMGCVMVIVSILPPTEFGPSNHRVDAPHFTWVQNLTLSRWRPRKTLCRLSEGIGSSLFGTNQSCWEHSFRYVVIKYRFSSRLSFICLNLRLSSLKSQFKS